MGLVAKLQELSQNLSGLVFDPQHVQRLVEQFNRIGIEAQIVWMPLPDVGQMPRMSPRVCLGRLKIDAPPLSGFELCLMRDAHQHRPVRIRFEHHYLVHLDAPPPPRVRARRVPQLRWWIVGRVIGYRWKGGELGLGLQMDLELNSALEDGGVGSLTVQTDDEECLLRIIQPFCGHLANRPSLLGMLSGDEMPEIVVPNEQPTPQRVASLVNLARCACRCLGQRDV